MVGGGIFAVTGLTIQVTCAGAPVAFLIAGIVALLTSYSYLKLTLRFPGEGGTVDFLNRGFGSGIVTGAANILLVMSYVVLFAIYAYAFGSYGASFFPEADRPFWNHALTSGVIVGLVVLNIFAANLVFRSENVFNAVKMLLLVGFVVAAEDLMGRTGFIAIAVAALLATSSAINATFFSTGKLAYIIAKTGEVQQSWSDLFVASILKGP